MLGLNTLNNGLPPTLDLSIRKPIGVSLNSLSILFAMVIHPVAVNLHLGAPDLMKDCCRVLIARSTFPWLLWAWGAHFSNNIPLTL